MKRYIIGLELEAEIPRFQTHTKEGALIESALAAVPVTANAMEQVTSTANTFARAVGGSIEEGSWRFVAEPHNGSIRHRVTLVVVAE